MQLLSGYKISAAALSYHPLISDHTPRIHIKGRAGYIDDENIFMVDTGSPYGFFWRHDLGLERGEVEVIEEGHTTTWRGQRWRGGLYRVRFEFIASHGKDLDLQAVCFVPDDQEAAWEQMPSLVGMSILEQIFFAFDLNAERFFFAQAQR